MLPPDDKEALGWHPVPEFWSANRAEHRFVDGHELIAFDLPAAHGFPAEIGWELFNCSAGWIARRSSPQARPRPSKPPKQPQKQP